MNLSKSRFLVVTMLLIELALALWIMGALRPLGGGWIGSAFGL